MRTSTALEIDVTSDIRSDSRGKDPDRFSPTLRRSHQLLWSKPLPNGKPFLLEDRYPNGYLYHQSDMGTYHLSSDMIIRTFRPTMRMRPIISLIPEADQLSFSRIGCTVGGTTIFPGNQINGQHTINQARGTSRAVEDRFDLTLECIRRFYDGNSSPLSKVFDRYVDFFNLFETFQGYADFFHFQDLVSEDYSEVHFFSSWVDFSSPALPQSLREYGAYRDRNLAFVENRNARIREWATRELSD